MTDDTLPEMPPIDAAAPAPDEAPKPRRGRPKGSTDKAPRTTARARKSTTPNLEKRLGASLTTLGTVACLASPADGMVIINGVPGLAAALAKLAEENPSVRANLERMLTAGAWSGVLAAVVPMVLGIMSNHGMVPPHLAAMLGAPTPPPAGAADGAAT